MYMCMEPPLPLAQPDARPKGEQKITHCQIEVKYQVDEVKIEVWIISPNTRFEFKLYLLLQ